MPDRDQSTPAPIPRLDPDTWEEQEGFRETLLRQFTEPETNALLRGLGQFLFNVSLECAGDWPRHPEGETRSELRAALADLRHLQGFLSALGREHVLSDLGPGDESLSRFAVLQAAEVRKIADRIEKELTESHPQ